MTGSTPASAPPVVAVPARSRYVHAGFVAAAPWYDRLTRAFSFGLDGWWRRVCLERCELVAGQALLDVATGTGELVIQARSRLGERGVAVGLDFCRAMLAEARRKRAGDAASSVVWIQGWAEVLPFRTESFDRVTVGFALRHVDLDEALREIARVLKPDGRFVFVEWTRPEARWARRLILGYMRWVVPPLVRVISRDRRVADLARYLPDSIEHFVSGPALMGQVQAAGLTVRKEARYFAGLVSLGVALKPPRPAEVVGAPLAERAGACTPS